MSVFITLFSFPALGTCQSLAKAETLLLFDTVAALCGMLSAGSWRQEASRNQGWWCCRGLTSGWKAPGLAWDHAKGWCLMVMQVDGPFLRGCGVRREGGGCGKGGFAGSSQCSAHTWTWEAIGQWWSHSSLSPKAEGEWWDGIGGGNSDGAGKGDGSGDGEKGPGPLHASKWAAGVGNCTGNGSGDSVRKC